MSEWISVKDRLPDAGEWYLISSDCNMPHDKIVTMAFLDCVFNGEDLEGLIWLTHNDSHRRVNDQNEEWDAVTHWMPLPNPPKQ